MNKILKRLRNRNIQTNFKQFLSVILIVFLSVTLLSGFIVNSSTLDRSIDKYFKGSNLADLWVGTDKVSSEDENFYVSNEIISDKRLMLKACATIDNVVDEKVSKIYVSDGKISAYTLETGKAGCLVDKNVAKNNNIKIGLDTVKFEFDYVISENSTIPIVLESRITGTMSNVECADTYTAWAFNFSEERFLELLNAKLASLEIPVLNELPYNEIVIKTDDIEKTKQKIVNYYSLADSNLLYILDRGSIESVVLLNEEVKQSKKMIYVFPIIFLIVSVLIILTTINQLVLQEKSKIGTLKSIGVPDKKILLHYSSYGAYLCAIGVILGLIFGPIIVPGVMFVKYDLVYSIPDNFVKINLPLHWLLLVAFGVILLGFLVSFLACLEILYKKPIECLRQDINIKIKSKKLNKKLKKIPLSLKMAFRNVRIKPVRTIMAIIGVAGCMALLLSGFGISDTLNYSLDKDFGDLLNYDISTTYSNNAFESDVQQIEGVTEVEKFLEYNVEISNNIISTTTTLYNVQENSKFINIDCSDNKFYVSKGFAKDKGIKIGDKITISVFGKKQEFVVTDFVETSLFNGVFTASELAFDEFKASKSMWINCAKNKEEIKQKINEINGTNSAKTIEDVRCSAENKISSIGVMTTTLKIFAILLVVVVLLNLVLLILKERIREIATLKVIGQKLMTIYFALLFEILIIFFIGSIFGMILGYPLLILILKVNKVKIMNFLYHINFVSYIFAGMLIIFTIILVTLFALWKIKKVNMIESLKSVE